MDTETIEFIQRVVQNPHGFMWKEVSLLVRLPDYEKEDLIQYLLMKVLSLGWPETKVERHNFCYNKLRKLRRMEYKRLEKANLNNRDGWVEDVIEVENDYSLLSYAKDIDEMGVLDETDLSVLKGWMSRHDAAEKLGLSYDAYKHRLARRIHRIRKLLDF